jgi:hypothetical protein
LQLRRFKRFELLKFLELRDTRAARRVVMREIAERTDAWWERKDLDGDRLEAAASDVCASYDILARMIERRKWICGKRHEAFFRRHWARSIVRTNDALSKFLAHRRVEAPDAYDAFSRLANAARRHLNP